MLQGMLLVFTDNNAFFQLSITCQFLDAIMKQDSWYFEMFEARFLFASSYLFVFPQLS